MTFLHCLMDFSEKTKRINLPVLLNTLKQYEANKLENVLQVLMKQLAATLSRQQGVQYEFGPEFVESHVKKLTGLQKTRTFLLRSN